MAGRKINAKEFAKDVAEGMSWMALMARYDVSDSQLEVLMEKVRAAGLLPAEPPETQVGIPQKPETATARCTKCGSSLETGMDECRRCGVMLPRIPKNVHEPSPTRGPSGISRTRGNDRVYEEKIDATAEPLDAYEEIEQETGISQAMLLGYTAAGLAAVTLLVLLIGPGNLITRVIVDALLLISIGYFLLILFEAFQQSTLWGVLILLMPPAALAFILRNYSTLFKGNPLTVIWLGVSAVLVFLGIYWGGGFFLMIPFF